MNSSLSTEPWRRESSKLTEQEKRAHKSCRCNSQNKIEVRNLNKKHAQQIWSTAICHKFRGATNDHYKLGRREKQQDETRATTTKNKDYHKSRQQIANHYEEQHWQGVRFTQCEWNKVELEIQVLSHVWCSLSLCPACAHREIRSIHINFKRICEILFTSSSCGVPGLSAVVLIASLR